MTSTAVELWQRIESCGLADLPKTRQWASEAAGSLPPGEAFEALAVATWLVRKGYLSEYQARVLLGVVTGPLRCGSYKIVAPVDNPSMPDWYRAIADGDGQTYWMLAVDADQIESGRFAANPPSVALAQRHAALLDAALTCTTEANFGDGHFCVVSTVPQGRSLRQTMSGVAMPRPSATAIAAAVAVALDRLHAAGLVHGDVGLHSVWWDGDRGVVLMRDPVFPPINPLADAKSISAFAVPPIARLRSAAAEFTAPGCRPTPQTDLYSLGCLWYELLCGRPRFDDEEPNKLLRRIVSGSPSPVAAEGWTPAMQRVLDHLLAADPDSRFSSAADFLSALELATREAPPRPAAAPPKAAAAPPKPAAPVKPASPAKPAAATAPAKPAAATEAVREAPSSYAVSPKLPNQSPLKSQPPQAAAPPATAPTAPTAATPGASDPRLNPKPAPLNPKPAPPKPAPPKPAPPKPVPPSVESAGQVAAAEAPQASIDPERPATPKRPALDLATLDLAAPPRRPAQTVGRRAGGRPAWFLPALAAVAVVLMGGLTWGLMRSAATNLPTSERRFEPPPEATEESADTTTAAAAARDAAPPPVDPVASQFDIVDDTQALWAPPHANDPIPLDWLPSGMQGLLHLNATSLRGQSLYAAQHELIGPSYAALADRLRDELGASLESYRAVTIAMYADDATQWPQLAVRATANGPKSVDDWFAGRPFETPREKISIGGRTVYWNSDSSFALAVVCDAGSSEVASVAVSAPPTRLREWIDMQGAIAPLTRQLEALRQASSVDNDLTYLTTTALLVSSGREPLEQQLASLLPTLRKNLLDRVAAVSIASNLGERWYGELRLAGLEAQTAPELAEQWTATADALAGEAESMLASRPPEPYWAKVAIRLPQQLRLWRRNLRIGVEDGQVVANFYLPAIAAPNLSFAAWMALRQPPSETTVRLASASEAIAEGDGERMTLAEMLDQPMTVAFEQESLEAASRVIAEEFNSAVEPAAPLAIQVNGAALQKEGITRNQQIRNFSHQGQPLRAVLDDLVRKGNPVTTVQSLTEVDQKLVWLIGQDEASIEITTRAAAQAAGQSLPAEFVAE